MVGIPSRFGIVSLRARALRTVIVLALALTVGCTPAAQPPARNPPAATAFRPAKRKPAVCASIVASFAADLSGEADPVDTVVGLLGSRRLRAAATSPIEGDGVRVDRVGRGSVLRLRTTGTTAAQALADCRVVLPIALEIARAPLSSQVTREIQERSMALRVVMEKKQLALWEFRLRFGSGGLNPEKRVEAADRRVVELEDVVLAGRRRRASPADLAPLEAQRNQAANEAMELNMRATEWERLKKDAEFTQQQFELLTHRLAEAEVRRMLGMWEILDECGPCDPQGAPDGQ
jgi:hypothetical protein